EGQVEEVGHVEQRDVVRLAPRDRLPAGPHEDAALGVVEVELVDPVPAGIDVAGVLVLVVEGEGVLVDLVALREARLVRLAGVVQHDAELGVDTRAHVEVPPLVEKVSLRRRSGPEDEEAEPQPSKPGAHRGAYRTIPKPLSSFGTSQARRRYRRSVSTRVDLR